MPIRFRCAYCNQLLGIARRKAGTVVRCPTCSGQVVVPTPEEGAREEAASPPGGLVFERPDFDEVFDPAKSEKKRTAAYSGSAPLPPPAPARPEIPAWPAPDVDVVRMDSPEAVLAPIETAPPSGYILLPRHLVLLTVAAVAALLLAFTAGLLVGLFLRPAPREVPPLEGTQVAPAQAPRLA